MDVATESRPVIDPITLEVIRHGVVAITDQIDANITRTAFSPYIYEYKDFAVGLVGPDGELVAQCRGGMPVFVADFVGMAVAMASRPMVRTGCITAMCLYVTMQPFRGSTSTIR